MVDTQTDSEQVRVLLIDDDRDDYVITRRLLRQADPERYVLDWRKSYAEGLEALVSGTCDVALVDYRLGAESGLDLIGEARRRELPTPLILLTGQGDLEVDRRAMRAGAADYLVKDQIDAPQLERSIRYARERRQAAGRIRAQAALLDKARDAICACDMDGRITYWNKSAERLTGWTAEEVQRRAEQEGMACLFASEAETLAAARRRVIERGEWQGELRQHTKGGTELIVENRWSLVKSASGAPQSILIIGTDVTEQKRLETQFLRSQRMESIGRLVGGIAHDLGNLLVPVLLGVEVLQKRHQEDERTQRTLGMIRQSAERGSDMVKQVLSFARGVEGERTALAVENLLGEVERIAEETFPNNIALEMHVPEALWKVRGDATQVQQVLVNLCVNARDAMPEGGTLVVRAENLAIKEDCASLSMDAAPGQYVCLTVTDTGAGIDPEDLGKVFEPFFTTKEAGKGTGLGLSTVYSIVKSHNGFVEAQSDRGRGTSFAVHLPAADQEAEAGAVPPEEIDVEIAPADGELVLVIDDEASVAEAARHTLESVNYRVLTATEGEAAWQLFEEHRAEINAVVTDLMMPSLNGLDLIRRIKRARPELPVIAASSPSDGRGGKALEAGADRFLPKPFTSDMLCVMLQKVLAEVTQQA